MRQNITMVKSFINLWRVTEPKYSELSLGTDRLDLYEAQKCVLRV